MWQFEQELIRAIEHGCPLCGPETGMALDANRRVTYWLGLKGGKVDYNEHEMQDYHDGSVVYCQSCGGSLWTAENGWIPELQEIVKGE